MKKHLIFSKNDFCGSILLAILKTTMEEDFDIAQVNYLNLKKKDFKDLVKKYESISFIGDTPPTDILKLCKSKLKTYSRVHPLSVDWEKPLEIDSILKSKKSCTEYLLEGMTPHKPLNENTKALIGIITAYESLNLIYNTRHKDIMGRLLDMFSELKDLSQPMNPNYAFIRKMIDYLETDFFENCFTGSII